MYQSKLFSMARAWHALRADLHQQSRAVLVGTGAAAAVILIANVFSPEPTGSDFHAAFFPLALVAGGFLFTSTLFSELPDKPRAHAYLTLPISTVERWAVRVLLSTVGYVAVALAGYFLVTLLGAGLSQLIRGWSHPVFAPSMDDWRIVLGYLVTSSLFLFGAVYFRRWNALKVVLSLAGLALGLVLIAVGLAHLLFSEFRGDVDLIVETAPRIGEAIEAGAKVFFWGIMGPLFWFLTWLRLSETEV